MNDEFKGKQKYWKWIDSNEIYDFLSFKFFEEKLYAWEFFIGRCMNKWISKKLEEDFYCEFFWWALLYNFQTREAWD